MARTIDYEQFEGFVSYDYSDSHINYDEIYTISNFYDKGLECCKNVRWKRSTTRFELDLLCAVVETLQLISTGKYRADPFSNFQLSERGKTRQISAQKIHDRMVQKVANQDIWLPICEPNFVQGNTASLRGKGKKFAIDNFIIQLKYHYALYGTEGGVLLGDFSNYFGSLPHEEIKRRVKERVSDLRTVKVICDCINDFRKIQTCHKAGEWGFAGIGLGSELSQTFALDYATPLDHYIEDNFNISGYGRYMDDFYIICDSLEQLHEIKRVITELVREMGVELSDKKTKIIPFKAHTFPFLKMNFKMLETGKVIVTPSRKNKKIIRKRLKKFREKLDAGVFTIEDVCNSYNGWRANIVGAKNSYTTVYNTDIYFINLFRKELAVRDKPFKCYIKCVNNNGEWEYITKPLPNSKDYSKKQKENIKNYNEKKKPKIQEQAKTNYTSFRKTRHTNRVFKK